MTKTNDVPFWVWAGLPAVSLAILWVSPLVLSLGAWQTYIMSERCGFVENVTVLYLLVVCVMGVRLAVRGRAMGVPMRAFMAVIVLGAFVLAGEEASWGQHWFGYATPDSIAANNRQKEFNLHNMRGGLHQNMTLRAKRALNGICLAGAAIAPLLLHRWRRHPAVRNRLADWAVPTLRLIPMACLVPLAKNFSELYQHTLHPALNSYGYLAFVRPASECKEMFFAMLVMAYLLSLSARLRANPQAAESAVEVELAPAADACNAGAAATTMQASTRQ